MKFLDTGLFGKCINTNGSVEILIHKIFCLDHPFCQVDVCVKFCRKRYYLFVVICHVNTEPYSSPPGHSCTQPLYHLLTTHHSPNSLPPALQLFPGFPSTHTAGCVVVVQSQLHEWHFVWFCM